MNEIQNQQTVKPNLISSAFKKNKRKKTSLIVGSVLLVLLLIGGVIVMRLSSQEQDVRNQASVTKGLVKVFLKTAGNCVTGNTCKADLYVNTGGNNVDALQLKIIPQDAAALQSLPFQDTQFGSMPERESKVSYCQPKDGQKADKMLRSCNTDQDCPEKMVCQIKQYDVIEKPNNIRPASILVLQKNEVANDKSIMLAWTLNSSDRPFNVSGDTMIGSIVFTPSMENKTIAFNFDPTMSEATLYKTGEDSLNTPDPLSISVVVPTAKPTIPIDPIDTDNGLLYCKSDSDCKASQYCYQPPAPKCPEGQRCPQAMPQCVDKKTPTAQFCDSNADCETGYICSSVPASGCANGQACATRPMCRQAEGASCRIDSDCFDGYSCYQPPAPKCPEGQKCPQAMPQAPRCTKDAKVTISISKQPSPPATATPTILVRPSTPVCMTMIPSCEAGSIPVKAISKKSDCPIYYCEEKSSCEYEYSDWSQCRAGIQTRTLVSKPAIDCLVKPTELSRSCETSCTSNRECPSGESCKIETNMNYGSCMVATRFKTDLNADEKANVLDLSIVLKFLFSNEVVSDVNRDGVTDIVDYSLILKYIQSDLDAKWNVTVKPDTAR